MSLPAAILCGGMATRLYPLTQAIPKALIEVAGEPFLAHQLRLLKASGIQNVVLCAGHLGEMLQDFADDGSRFGLKVDYSFDGPVLLGTAGALRQALPHLGDLFFVLYGDSYLPCDYSDIACKFRESGKQAMMTVHRNEGLWDGSNVEMTARNEIRVYDKENRTPSMRHIDYGLGVFRAAALNRVPPGGRFDLAELYRQLLAEGRLAAYEVPERFYEIGSFEGIHSLEDYLTARKDE
jgi:NDP-sugar pyrophosphorylase family protein